MASTILHYIRLCINYILSFFNSNNTNESSGIGLSLFASSKRLVFDNGLQVTVGKQIAEGGFSYVFEAYPVDGARMTNSRSSSTVTVNSGSSLDGRAQERKYALKRINCSDSEIVQSCRHEAGIHRTLPQDHPNLLELLGLKFDKEPPPSTFNPCELCYMLFPFVPNSLRSEITTRNILLQEKLQPRRPFTSKEILQLFGGLVDGLAAMHRCNISHRDFKIENILLQCHGYTDRSNSGVRYTPVVMDFGSAGPMTTLLRTRQQVLTVVETAASHTTLPYRPPELFDGGCRHGPRQTLDYGRVDVWSLGCVLFGLMHGSSPFELEFARSINGRGRWDERHDGRVRIVECTHLKILAEVPYPPDGTDDEQSHGRNGRYPSSLYQFVRHLTEHDRTQRPNLQEVTKKFAELFLQVTGARWISYEDGRDPRAHVSAGRHDDFDSLIASRAFV